MTDVGEIPEFCCVIFSVTVPCLITMQIMGIKLWHYTEMYKRNLFFIASTGFEVHVCPLNTVMPF